MTLSFIWLNNTQTDGLLFSGNTGEINLNRLPWHKIAADLREVQSVTFDHPSVRYAWLGQGKVKFNVNLSK